MLEREECCICFCIKVVGEVQVDAENRPFVTMSLCLNVVRNS